jgi:hypothetical protein
MKTPLLLIFCLALFGACASDKGHLICGDIKHDWKTRIEVTVTSNDQSIDRLPSLESVAQIVMPYPAEMRRIGVVLGEVRAKAVIQEDGRISDLVIDHASRKEFAEAVINGLPRCKFFPARSRDIPVRCSVICTVEFELQDEE